MKLIKFLSLVPYRIPINSSLLQKSAEEMLAQAGKEETLLEYLGWQEFTPELAAGFPPQKNAKEWMQLFKDCQKRKELKSKRIANGFANLTMPRTGVKGWIQKKFRDPKELQLPLGYDLFVWLRESPRLNLLTCLHDALLTFCTSAEPRKVDMEEVTEHPNAFCPAIAKLQPEAAAAIQKALTVPLKSVDPSFLIQYCAGYVTRFDTQKGVAYYFSEPY